MSLQTSNGSWLHPRSFVANFSSVTDMSNVFCLCCEGLLLNCLTFHAFWWISMDLIYKRGSVSPWKTCPSSNLWWSLMQSLIPRIGWTTINLEPIHLDNLILYEPLFLTTTYRWFISPSIIRKAAPLGPLSPRPKDSPHSFPSTRWPTHCLSWGVSIFSWLRMVFMMVN